jgi:hypothetical protein
MSAVKKLSLMPGMTALCRSCRAPVGVPWARSIVTVLTFLLIFSAGFLVSHFTARLAIWLAAFTAGFAMDILYVPLHRRKTIEK